MLRLPGAARGCAMGTWGCDELVGQGWCGTGMGQEVVHTGGHCRPLVQGDTSRADTGPGARDRAEGAHPAHPARPALGTGLELARCRLLPPPSSPTPLPSGRRPIHKFSASCLLNLACLQLAAGHAHQHAECSCCCCGDLQPRSLHRHWAGVGAVGRGSVGQRQCEEGAADTVPSRQGRIPGG